MNKLFFILMAVFISLSGFAQDKSDLEKKKDQLLKDIQYTNQLLSETAKNRETTMSQLELINTKIRKRQELINAIVRETKMLQRDIDETSSIVANLETDLSKLKDEYGKMLFHTYRNINTYDRLMYIFSSKDFEQAYKRLKYFEQYSKYRQQQAQLIEETRDALSHRVESLDTKRHDRAMLLETSERERLTLNEEREEQDKMVDDLQDKEGQLRSELQKKDKEKKKLERAIQRIIEAEIAKAKKKEKRTGSTVTKSGFALTPAEMTLSNNFFDNKGKLPWPSERGVITSSFGEHPHPTLRDIKVVNNGIDIRTEEGAEARAVFAGVVSAVVVIPGANKAVILRHGEYLSVYSNLAEVAVKMGDEISVKQNIGLVATDRLTGKTDLHLEIWKGATKLNPKKWIMAQK
ncbi:MAG: septal ring factor EnvC (AmiA/AmiB activator) [Granulosicoccus sp.]|jgi:septal ring factor EnvC (AmiA/AmiB activator)